MTTACKPLLPGALVRGVLARTALAALAVTATMAALGAAGAATAAASPIWNLFIHHQQTNFPPGGTAEYWFEALNTGEDPSSGEVTLKIVLPQGLTRASVRQSYTFPEIVWSCPGSPGDTTVICTTSEPVPHHLAAAGLVLTVNVDPSASGVLTTTATVEGGGAPAAATETETTTVSSEQAPFGIVPNSFNADFYGADGLTPERQSGSHPFQATFAFDLSTYPDPNPSAWPEVPYFKAPVGHLRDLQVELPPGFLGNPTATGECAPLQLTRGSCPPSSMVGRIDLGLSPFQVNTFGQVTIMSPAVYNMQHPRGAIADLAFSIVGNPVHIRATLDPANKYAVKTMVPNVNETLPVYYERLTLWGVPGDPRHDWERCALSGNVTLGLLFSSQPCPIGIPSKPFLTVPFDCAATNVMRLSNYDSWQYPGVYGPEVTYTEPGQMTGCERLRFEPKVEVNPTGHAAATPTGLDVHVKVPQNETPNGLSTPPAKSFVVTLPEGMTVSPSFASGLTGCSSGQIALGTDDPVACPDSSRIGTVQLTTGLLSKPLEGSMYLAAQGDNPFHTPFAMYLVFHDTEERGILIKVPGRLDLNSVSGQITATFDELPQFPFEDLEMSFRSGPRAPLVNPPVCGPQAIEVAVASYAEPQRPVDASSTYDIGEGPEGSACPPSLAGRPFAPSVLAGTVNPTAGAYSPFVFRFTRSDADQDLGRIETTLPPGLMANVASIAKCPDATLASISEAEGTGHAEAEHPSCPESSLVGTLHVGMGAGPGPDYFSGKVYLAGAYEGAPLSLAIVVPALAGPYDLGTVVVRAAIYVDPRTAQIRVVSDPFPRILHGILLRVRDVRLLIDRAGVTFNPTNCEPMSVTARLTADGGDGASAAAGVAAGVATPFRATECDSLSFKPRLTVSTAGRTSRANGASLHVKLTYPSATFGTQANLRQVKVDLPKQLPSRLTTLQKACPDTTFNEDPAACPPDSRVGSAVAVTPVVPVVLEGPAYFVSHGGQRFPELVVVLQGYGLTVDLHGETFIGKSGITSSTFHEIPDVPIGSFQLDLPQGPYSALAANGNLCAASRLIHVRKRVVKRVKGRRVVRMLKVTRRVAGSLQMPTEFVAQNGVAIRRSVPIAVNGCPRHLSEKPSAGKRRRGK